MITVYYVSNKITLHCESIEEQKRLSLIPGVRQSKQKNLFMGGNEPLVVEDIQQLPCEVTLHDSVKEWLKPPAVVWLSALDLEATILRPYQKEGVEWIRRNNGILGDEPGLGKTLQALYGTFECKKKIIVCPAYVASHWIDHIDKWFPTQTYVDCTTPKNRIKKIQESNTNFIIINLEALRKDDVVAALMEKFANCIIVDEAHRLQGRAAKQNIGAAKLANSIDKIILLTGSVIWNSPHSVWHLLHILDSKRFSSFWAFVDRYCEVEETIWGQKILGMKESQIVRFKTMLRQYMLRRKKEDVAKDLPPKVYNTIYYNVDKKEYNNCLEDPTISDMKRLITLRQICNTHSNKDAVLLDILNDYDGKIVLFVWYRQTIEHLQQLLEKAKISFVSVSGDISPADRTEILNTFREDENIRVVIAGIGAVAYGIDLDVAQTGVFYEQDWVPTNNKQAEDRLHRIKTQHTVTIINLIGKNSIEQHIFDLTNSKTAINNELLAMQEILKTIKEK